MMNRNRLFLIALASALAACGGSEDAGTSSTMVPVSGSDAVASQEIVTCPSDPGISYICGLMNAEDLLTVGDTGMILASGMSGEGVTGHLYLVNPLDDTWEDLVFGDNYYADHDQAAYPACPGPMDLSDFAAHGLALKETGDARFDLYITSHGAREAIEIFDLDLGEGVAELTWKGCVPMDSAVMHNSVAILPDGGFVTTQFMRWDAGFESVFAEEPNGGVVEWHPGGEPALIDGTMEHAPNGIVVSDDGRYIFIAAFGGHSLVRFDRSQTPVASTSVALDIAPDNVRWGETGKLLTAGNNNDGNGWSVVEVDAGTMEATVVGSFDQSIAMQGISTALQVNDELWVGTYSGDRIAYFPKQ